MQPKIFTGLGDQDASILGGTICPPHQLYQDHLLTRLSFPPLNELGNFVENQLTMDVRIYSFSLLCSSDRFVYLLNMTMICLVRGRFLPRLILSSEIRQYNSFNVTVFQSYFGNFRPFVFPYKFRSLSLSTKACRFLQKS